MQGLQNSTTCSQNSQTWAIKMGRGRGTVGGRGKAKGKMQVEGGDGREGGKESEGKICNTYQPATPAAACWAV